MKIIQEKIPAMQNIEQLKGRRLHSRTIEISTYESDGQRLIIEGSLKDERFQDSHLISGEKLPPGFVHHMCIRLLINLSSFVIEDIDVSQPAVPRVVCRETIDSLAPIRGLNIARGFTKKVKTMAGGVKGCTHLVELLQAMATAAFQGYAAYQSQKPTGFDEDHMKVAWTYLLNTCHAWREDGPYAEMFKKYST